MNQHPYKVLVIEDNSFNLELVKDLLEAHGQVVWAARTAEEGLSLARSTLPDLVLMDLSLPGMDGLAAIRAIRSDPELRELPVVALTACAMKGDQERALNAGCDGYLTKPIDTRTFVRTALEFIAGAHRRQARDLIHHEN